MLEEKWEGERVLEVEENLGERGVRDWSFSFEETKMSIVQLTLDATLP